MVRAAIRFLAVACLLSVAMVPARAGDATLTVVELYTSQGCASCPPADALLTELSQRQDVLALSFHVNYWDYMGWRDSLALARNTDRQRDYARTFGRSYVYTPQMVIDGAAETTGRDVSAVRRLIEARQTVKKVPVFLTPTPGGGMKIGVAGAAVADTADVWLVFFDRDREARITRGENSGRILHYSNVVRHVEQVASWTGESLEVDVTPASKPGESCAVLLQSRGTGHILGAARLAGSAPTVPSAAATAGNR